VAGLPQIMRANRAFLRRAVRFLVDSGIRQFLDIGSGIPTAGNVHSVAQRRPTSGARSLPGGVRRQRPVAVAHSRALLEADPTTAVLEADLRRPEDVLGHPELSALLDLDQPIAVLMVAVLHFVPAVDQPRELIAQYRDAVPAGSYLAISHATRDGQPELAAEHQTLYRRTAIR